MEGPEFRKRQARKCLALYVLELPPRAFGKGCCRVVHVSILSCSPCRCLRHLKNWVGDLQDHVNPNFGTGALMSLVARAGITAYPNDEGVASEVRSTMCMCLFM